MPRANNKISLIITFLLVILLFFNCIDAKNIVDNRESRNNSDLSDVLFDIKIRTLMRLGSHKALSACIIKNDSVVWSKGYGEIDLLGLKPATNKTIYLISSTTKAITATALMQLYEKGLFDLDDDVNEYLPFSLRNPNFPEVNITFRMLFSHRASLYDHFLWTNEGRREIFKDYLTDRLMESPYPWIKDVLTPGSDKYIEEYWMDYPPGDDAAYSNTGYMILGYLLEIISGRSVEEYCQENIFKPLKMNDTSYHVEGLDEDRVIRPYFRVCGVFVPLESYDTKGFACMCGVRTTVDDLSHFFIAHMNNGTWNNVRILEESTVDLMHTIFSYDEDGFNIFDYRYGLGWFETDKFGQTMEGHGGDNFGYLATMFMNKSTKTGFIFLTSGSPPTVSIFKNPVHAFKSLLWTKVNEIIGRALLKKAGQL